jgi:broad specificity phosphatase PhoE
MERLKKTVQRNLGKTLLVVPHGTPMKAVIAEAKGIAIDRVQCNKGSYYAAEFDEQGHVRLIEGIQSGISIESH